MQIKSRIRTIAHYPHEGIMFRDITTLLKDPIGLRATVQEIANRYKSMKIDKVAGIESRGFIIEPAGCFPRRPTPSRSNPRCRAAAAPGTASPG